MIDMRPDLDYLGPNRTCICFGWIENKLSYTLVCEDIGKTHAYRWQVQKFMKRTGAVRMKNFKTYKEAAAHIESCK